MHVLSVSAVTASVEGRTLFSGVSFGVATEDAIGVIGPNGSGKTTLLTILSGLRPPDAGEVVRRRGARIVYLDQDTQLADELTALDAVLQVGDQGVREHEALALLDRLGVTPRARTDRLSGGQRRRVALARALLPASDLLVLDEPTNHLDVDTVDWLEDELRRRTSGLLLVTHDRYLLERLTTRMLEIEPGGAEPATAAASGSRPGAVHWHEGSYSDVLEAQAGRRARQAEAEQRRQNLLRKEIAWLRRDPRARTSKPRFRTEQARSLMASSVEEQAPQLQLGTGRRRLGSQVIDAEAVTVCYGEHTVLDDVSLDVGPGDRIGIVGPNGSGKTTLLRVLAGELTPDAGTVRIGRTVEIGTYAQEATAAPRATTVLDTILAVAPHVPLATGETLPAGRLAERFGFSRTLQRAAVARLSGGERRRLALLHLLIAAPNVLVLDEPTNDLDLETLRALEDHLDGFTGTVLVASHDRYLLDRLTDRLYAVEGGRLRPHLHWDAWRGQQLRARSEADREAAPSGGSAKDNRGRQERRRQVRALEHRIDRLERQRRRLHAALADAAADFERAARLDAERQQVEAELTALEERWLELTVD